MQRRNYTRGANHLISRAEEAMSRLHGADIFLFGKAKSRVVVTVANDQLDALESALKAAGAAFEIVGEVTSGDVIVDSEHWGSIVDWKNKYDTAIENILKGRESEHALSAL